MNQKISSYTEVDLGERWVSHMNHSVIMTLPPPFIRTYLKDTRRVRVTMTYDGSLIVRPA